MFVATVAVSALLAAMLAASAALKLSHADKIVAFYATVGVPERMLNPLAALLLAAAAGLAAGLLWAPVGVAAAAGLIGYFAVAIGFHMRVGDLKGLPTPALYLALAAAALALRLATA
jgi:hypothetical protein